MALPIIHIGSFMNHAHLIAAFVAAAIAGASGVAHANDEASGATDGGDTLNEVVVTGTRVTGQSQIGCGWRMASRRCW